MKLMELYQDKIVGAIRGLDRIRFRGTLRWLASQRGLATFMGHSHILLKDFSQWVNGLTAQIRNSCQSRAEALGIAVRYLASSGVNKEKLAREIVDLAGRARERKLGLDEMRGGSCTITNIGPLGGVFATPIINQPELAIVGLHTIQQRPVVRDGEIVIRDMMYLSISFDHRWIDGAQGARFMTAFARLVSNPNLLLARL